MKLKFEGFEFFDLNNSINTVLQLITTLRHVSNPTEIFRLKTLISRQYSKAVVEGKGGYIKL